jgi:hypothetical protein
MIEVVCWDVEMCSEYNVSVRDGLMIVLGCAGMCWDVLGCAGMCWDVLGCAGMCWDVLGCELHSCFCSAIMNLFN